jgi:hypothetical protein
MDELAYKLNVDPLQLRIINHSDKNEHSKSNQKRLVIIRYNYVSVEYVGGLSKRQIIRYLVEVSTVFPLLHPDALEQEPLSCHLHTLCREGSSSPSTQTDCLCPNHELTPLPICLLAGHSANSAVH